MEQAVRPRQKQGGLLDLFLTLGILLCLIVGVGALAYPLLRNTVNDKLVDQIIAKEADKQKTSQALAEQMKTRQEVARQKSLDDPYSQESLNELHYNPITLPIYLNHLLGDIYLPSIGQYLPIFDNSSEQFLQTGSAWLPLYSPLTGGLGQHSVVAGHSGIPSATLFNNVPKMKKGDLIIYKIAGDYLAYRVFQMTEVPATEREAIIYEADKDLTTLVTCVPIGINTHRLLVTGERIPFTPSMMAKIKGMKEKKSSLTLWLYLGLSLIGLIILIILIRSIRSYLKYKPKHKASKGKA